MEREREREEGEGGSVGMMYTYIYSIVHKDLGGDMYITYEL